MTGPASDRTTVRRGAVRAEYERMRLLEILDRGLVAHVGVSTPEGPIVLPMAYGRGDHCLYLHGATGNAMLRSAEGSDVCVTVTIVDGLVVARTPFHNSMNYRSVVVRGTASAVTDEEEKREALRAVSDHVVETWSTGREPDASEIRRTLVLRVPLTEVSGKVRTGDPVDESGDLLGPHWAGQVPLEAWWGAPIPAKDLSRPVGPPPAVAALQGTPVAAGRPAPFVIDALTASDLAEIGWSGSAAHLRNVRQQLDRVSAGEVAYLCVRLPDGTPVAKGGVDFAVEPGAGTIYQLATHPEWRGRGLASSLIAALETATRARGLTVSRLGVEEENARAYQLYERLGYRSCGTTTDAWEAEREDGTVYLHEATCTVMTKRLGPPGL